MPLTEAAIPEAFQARMEGALGDEYVAFYHALLAPPPVSVRLNPHKADLGRAWGEPIAWCAEGRYLAARPSFTLDPLLHAGAYYVQEPSSMLVAEAAQVAADLSQDLAVLDLCAAPGGKTTLLASRLTPGSLLLANEPVRPRARILAENLTRWGRPGTYVSVSEPGAFAELGECFDLVLVDAPCSGEGLWRKEPQAVQEWSPAAVAACSVRQAQILKAAAALVKPGGSLIYATCTYAPEENSAQVADLLAALPFEAVPVPRTEGWGLVAQMGMDGQCLGYQAYPHRVWGEGFFFAIVRKKGGNNFASSGYRSHAPAWASASAAATGPLAGLLAPRQAWAYGQGAGGYFAYPAHHAGLLQEVARQVSLFVPGLQLGELKGKDYLPAHALALSTALHPDVPRLELPRAEALRYLKGESPAAETMAVKGWAVATFEGLALGWLKQVPGRLNNYLPAAARIRMDLPKNEALEGGGNA